MSDYKELVKELRNRRICIQALGTLNDYPLLGEAADAIEDLISKLNHADEQIQNLVEVNENLRAQRVCRITRQEAVDYVL